MSAWQALLATALVLVSIVLFPQEIVTTVETCVLPILLAIPAGAVALIGSTSTKRPATDGFDSSSRDALAVAQALRNRYEQFLGLTAALEEDLKEFTLEAFRELDQAELPKSICQLEDQPLSVRGSLIRTNLLLICGGAFTIVAVDYSFVQIVE